MSIVRDQDQMAAAEDRNAQRSQQLFGKAGPNLQAQLAGLGDRLNQFRDAAASKLPFLTRKAANASDQRFFCSGVNPHFDSTADSSLLLSQWPC